MISRTTRDIMFTNEINELILHEKTSTKNKQKSKKLGLHSKTI